MKRNETLQQFLDRISSKPQNKIPGGCEHCDAYQTFGVLKEGIYQMNIHHDDWCPTLQKINRAKN
jgi:hypothetical protein